MLINFSYVQDNHNIFIVNNHNKSIISHFTYSHIRILSEINMYHKSVDLKRNKYICT